MFNLYKKIEELVIEIQDLKNAPKIIGYVVYDREDCDSNRGGRCINLGGGRCINLGDIKPIYAGDIKETHADWIKIRDHWHKNKNVILLNDIALNQAKKISKRLIK